MKISYAQAFQAAPSLTQLASKPFSTSLAIKLVDIIDQLNPHLMAIDKFRTALSEGATTEVSEEMNKQFVEYLNNTTADIQIALITPHEADSAGLAFTVREMSSLRFAFAPHHPLPS